MIEEEINNNNTYIYLSDAEEIKSNFKIGNIIICLPRKYNWFQKKMYKLFFNIDLEEGSK